MRLRNVKGARELIESNSKLIIDNQTNEPLDIANMFLKKQPIHIEIGMGKGQFIYELAQQHPEINYIGIERFDSVIVRALEKVLEAPLSNLYLLRTDAEQITTLFPNNSIERIYLNFSDPWPKDRHAKRRLTSPTFLKRYQMIIVPQGELHFKTDNPILFDYSVESMREYGLDLRLIDNDLHSHENYDNIMTEFEAKFVKEGKPIRKIIARFKEEHNG